MEQIHGQIQAFAFNFPPKDWAFCDGQNRVVLVWIPVLIVCDTKK